MAVTVATCYCLGGFLIILKCVVILTVFFYFLKLFSTDELMIIEKSLLLQISHG